MTIDRNGGIDVLKRFSSHDTTYALNAHLVTSKELFDKHAVVAAGPVVGQRIEDLTEL
ncbi:MAG: hypothetical protein M1318_00630 [Firmicutes bacterium]|nr:hypothetical protein [Bacillota bacterium]